MDGSGSIDDYEFICGLALFMQTSIDQRLEAVFQLYDVNGSQTCDNAEFSDLVEAVLSLNSTVPITQSKLASKIKELKEMYAPGIENVAMTQFTEMAQYDSDLRKSLVDIGVMTLDEVSELGDDPDLAEESRKLDMYVEKEDEGQQSMPERAGGVPLKGLDNFNFGGESGENDGLFQTEEVDGGDQFMAIKPWKGAVKNATPSWYKSSAGESDPPNASLEMKYIYGYRCHDTRNNIFYNPEGKLVYHTAKVGIQLDTKENRQKFVVRNVDDIISMACWENLCATGDITNKPALVIWDNITMQPLVELVGVCRKGIAMIAFSTDGKLIACSCMDPDSTIWVFDVQKLISGQRESRPILIVEAAVLKDKGPKDKLWDMKFDQSNSTLVAASKNEIYLMHCSASKLSIKKASGWNAKTSNKQGTMCVGFVGNETVVGCIDGKILRLRAGSITSALDAHKGCVNTIFGLKNNKGFISGASDGVVIVWDSAFTKSQVITLSSFKDIPILNPRVRAVSMSPDEKKIVIGTRSSNIIEFNTTTGTAKCVNYGHFDNELWGLAVIPRSDEIVTCGEDFMLAKWNLKEKRVVRVKRIAYMATVCDVSSDAQMLAVGCKNGKVLVMNTADLTAIKEIQSGSKQISELKFSPDCKLLAVGSHDSRIRIYTTTGFKLVNTCTKNLSTVTHIDWATNSQVLQSNSTSYEILYFTSDGRQVTSGGSDYKEEAWASWTCVIGWPVQGIWPAEADGTDVNAVIRNKDKTVLATSDDFGTVKLFKYPCVKEKAANQEFIGHSSHVTNVRFSAKEDFLLSTGGNDKCIIQWKYSGPSGANAEEEEGEVNLDGYIPSDLETIPSDQHLRPSANKAGAGKEANQPAMYGGFEIEENDDGDQALAVKPFLGEIKPSMPRNFKEDPQGHLKPMGNLTLKHAFGFRCFDAKDSAKFGESSNTCVFITAALGVVMDITSLNQTFFNMHDEDLVSMDLTPDRRFCATGSMPAKGRSKNLDIYVWDTQTKQKAAYLTGFHTGAVKHLKFSPSGNLLLSVGLDENNSLAVYDWRNQRKVCDSKVDRTPVFDCDWQDENTLALVGKDSLKVFSLSNGSCSGRKGAWGKNTRVALACCKYVGNVCFTGAWNGTIIPWNGTSCGKAINAHQNAVFCLHYDTHKKYLLSGGKDGMIFQWKVTGDSLQQVSKVFDYMAVYGSAQGGIRAIDTHQDGSMLIGTRTAELIKVGRDSTHVPFMNAHYEGELWGLACHPTEPLFVTSGGDRSIRVFDCASKYLTQLFFSESDVRAVDWSRDGQHIVAASVDGEIMLFNAELEKLFSLYSSFTKKKGEQWIEEIKFSPDTQMVAFGSHGGYSPVEVMLVKDNKLSKYAVIKVGFTSALLHLDWSSDSNFIVTNSQAAELKFLDVKAQQQIRSSDTKDIQWATWSCKFGWPVQGIWPGVDYSDVNTVYRSENEQVLATGEDTQKVKLFRFPCTREKAEFKSYTAHASHVTSVRFMLKDNLLISTGGNDKTTLVWQTDFGDQSVLSKLMGHDKADVQEEEE